MPTSRTISVQESDPRHHPEASLGELRTAELAVFAHADAGWSEVFGRLDALWRAARRHEVRDLQPSQLRAEIREVATAARGAGMRPEQFLWVVKESWSALPEVRTNDRQIARDLLSGIVTLCIDEFYRD